MDSVAPNFKMLSGHIHNGKCIRRFAGINVYFWYFIDQMW